MYLMRGVSYNNMCRLQSKSLIGDQSIVFSPPSIIKETLCDEKSFSFNDAFTFPKSPSISAIKVRLSSLLCGLGYYASKISRWNFFLCVSFGVFV